MPPFKHCVAQLSNYLENDNLVIEQKPAPLGNHLGIQAKAEASVSNCSSSLSWLATQLLRSVSCVIQKQWLISGAIGFLCNPSCRPNLSYLINSATFSEPDTTALERRRLTLIGRAASFASTTCATR